MNLKQFIDEYKNCPLCGHQIRILSDQADRISVINNRLTIGMKSGYFIEPNMETFEFSLSIINGNILFTNSTNQFISLYDLNIFLRKDCKCSKDQSFMRCIKIFYDRTTSSFKSEPFMEHFSFIYDKTRYVFFNNYSATTTSIIVSAENNMLENVINVSYVPFEKFNFHNKEKLFSKINSILLLS